MAVRWFVISIIVLMTAAAATITFGAVAVWRAEPLTVDVASDSGSLVSVRVPALFADLAVTVVPEQLWDEASDELHPLLPTLGAIGEELARAPDFVLL